MGETQPHAGYPAMKLTYKVIRSERSNVRITVERDRRIVVRAPRQASDGAVAAAVERKRLWIWEKLRDPHKYPEPAPRKEYVSGETFLFLGQPYTLILKCRNTSSVKLIGDVFEMSAADQKNGDAVFHSWYLAQAKEKMRPRIARIAAGMGVAYSRIWIRHLKYRWGSCTPGGTLSFNWRLIQAPMIVVDYLIVHELAHILEPNHSHDFWNIVAVHAPSWKNARSWLKQYGGMLEW
jgi:predicted metal-dependent hydrolase